MHSAFKGDLEIFKIWYEGYAEVTEFSDAYSVVSNSVDKISGTVIPFILSLSAMTIIVSRFDIGHIRCY